MAQVKTAAEMFPLVESWQKSGLTQKEFSQQHGVSEHVFYYWVSRYRNAQPVSPLSKSGPVAHTKPVADAPKAAAFIRLSCPGEAVPPAARTVAEATTVVELPSGVVVRFTGLVPVAYLKELLTCSLV
jgi:transposase-like protein